MTIPEYIASQLFINGVRFVFGIPGGPSIPYIEAFRKAGIEFILTSNETSAGIMADVTGRLTGIPGICHATFGPGATNISTGVGGALLDRSPVIVFTSETGAKMINRTTQMNIDHQKLFEPLTKATFRANETNIKEVLHEALRISTDIYPGPVHIGLPADIAEIETDNLPDKEYRVPEEPSYNNPESNEAIINLLENCRSPLIALGLTAARIDIRQKLLPLLEIDRKSVV